ncbi:excisionase family DNA-binding protein [Saccharopolyspora sp. NPDC003752]
MITSGAPETHKKPTSEPTGQLPRRAWKPKEVAQQLGIPYETVLDLIHANKLGAVTAGRYYLVPDFELERFLRTTQKSV